MSEAPAESLATMVADNDAADRDQQNLADKDEQEPEQELQPQMPHSKLSKTKHSTAKQKGDQPLSSDASVLQ